MLPPPLSVTLPPPSRTTWWLVFTTLAVAVMVIVTGSGPQSKVMMPPSATACTTAADVHPAGVPSPITWSGWLVSTAWAATGTAARPSGLPARSGEPPDVVAPLAPAAARVLSVARAAVMKTGWPSAVPAAGLSDALAGRGAEAVKGPAQAAAPVSKKPAATSLAQIWPNRPTSRMARMLAPSPPVAWLIPFNLGR